MCLEIKSTEQPNDRGSLPSPVISPVPKCEDVMNTQGTIEPSTSKTTSFETRTRKSNWFCDRGFSPLVKKSSNSLVLKCPYVLNIQATTEPFENKINNKSSRKKKIVVHNIAIIKPSNGIENKKYENEDENLEEHGNDILSETPKDPLYTSDDSDSNFEPSDGENGHTSVPHKFSIGTGVSKLKFKESLSNTKNVDQAKLDDLHKKNSVFKPVFKRKADYCYFCETEVKNFARHIIRKHSTEIAVAEILSKPSKSIERRKLLDKLRRKGNFLANPGKCFKAVRQTYITGSLLPCDNCLGFFSSKLLYRHRKKCINGKSTGSAQIEGQSKLITNSNIPRQLKEQVFPHMRADNISMEAKNDILICQFGARCLMTHREKHFVRITSRKMRELSKILIELRKLEPSITNMFSALKPRYFDLFVEATKNIADYNIKTNTFTSPTFAMNIATSLKQCCDVAITYAYKLSVSTADTEANLKTLIELFEVNWRSEIITQAGNHNKWNEITVVSLANDLKLLREYLMQVAEKASTKLRENNAKYSAAYNTLMETVYCRVILLNRKRFGELQRMLLQTYINCNENQNYEEFNKAVSNTEKIILKSFKRVVIRGKKGGGVPVLFSRDVQNHIEILLNAREKYIPKENPHLFAKINSLSHLIGYKILNSYAKRCGAKHPSAITSTRLRNHLASLCQLFNMNENEVEQLATFMEHTPGIRRGSYRIPDDVYQTAKMSKLLLLMEKGAADEYKGKSLDEINIDLEENLFDNNEKSDESDSEFDQNCLQKDPTPFTSTIKTDVPSEARRIVVRKKGKCRTLVPWTSEQKQIVKQYFTENINIKKAPIRKECEELKLKYPKLLDNKNWLKIKVFIQNEYNKKNRKSGN